MIITKDLVRSLYAAFFVLAFTAIGLRSARIFQYIPRLNKAWIFKPLGKERIIFQASESTFESHFPGLCHP